MDFDFDMDALMPTVQLLIAVFLRKKFGKSMPHTNACHSETPLNL